MLKRFVIMLCLLLTGCSSQWIARSDIDGTIEQNNQKIFIGIPVLASLEGSMARLDESWILTAKHNRVILALQGREVYYHPYCDIALVKNAGTISAAVGMVFNGQEILHVGYPIGLPLSASKGKYVGDVFVQGWDGCQMSATTGVVSSGMSGGGVYNDHAELIGINHGYVSGSVLWPNGEQASHPAVFVSLYAVKDWLQLVTGKDYYR
ncbi:serine protease [Vibrio sp. H11]|uniref:serine protease n=1 Tax=Vibrio sp. H11 TaxID=2565928 RepID=UPI0010A683CA|nr:serine protease [Vibrio sp. H11]